LLVVSLQLKTSLKIEFLRYELLQINESTKKFLICRKFSPAGGGWGVELHNLPI